ncbi:MAG: uracil-DNA glycosylase [Alphaproteobacteria bacterium]|nr:uracil-DNA glycosylase [Alphaproteobacteria bacterium]
MSFVPPDRDCSLCPRLVRFRMENRAKFPDKFNAPVPAFGPLSAEILIVGLAPGLKGANFTGRPFTGDYAGDLLYATLLKFGLAEGEYAQSKDDGLTLVNCRITNAVRCVPPENKPIGMEEAQCRDFLAQEMAAMSRLKTIIALGLVSHRGVLRALGLKVAAFKFSHNVRHDLGNGLTLLDSYHCSRYNTQTNRLTPAMFEDVFRGL